MVVHDRVYGLQQIREPVILELIESVPFKRLKRINQAGASQYLFPWKDVTRYEHSIGVMLLLRMFGAELTEQVAGLLHDLPHTAFSHVVDFVFANPHHNYHELFHESVINNSEIKFILKKYKIPVTVAHPENFSLLERDIPDLCADRIDYTFRDFFSWKGDLEGIAAKLAGLIVHRGEFIFKDQYSAEAFARDYLDFDRRVWADPREIALYELLAQAIRHALDKKILTNEDLFTDDVTVLGILKSKGDAYIHKKLGYLTPSFRLESATREHHHLSVKTKNRYVDPKILLGKKIVRLSDVSRKFKTQLIKHIKRGNTNWYVNVYPN
ncbi:MAG: HD domain-containing protein [Patescibacteria group bacterium]